MFLSKLRISAIVMALTLSAMGASLWAQPRPAQRERDKPRVEVRPGQGDGRVANPREAHGTIKALDADKGTITVTLIEGRQETVEKTFTLPKNVEVGVNTGGGRRGGAFREGSLNDLATGTMVLLQLADDKQTVECILADGPTVHGTIKGVDAGKNTITVASTTRGSGREAQPETQERTFTIAAGADIAVDDGRGKLFSVKETKLADLPVGAIVSVKLSADSKNALFILAEGPTVTGTVKSVDAGKRQIQLSNRRGVRGGDDQVDEKTLAVSPTTSVILDDGKSRRFSVKEGKLEDIPVGALATVRLAADQQTATVIQVQGPTASGAVKAVDADKGAITLVTLRRPGRHPGRGKVLRRGQGRACCHRGQGRQAGGREAQ